MPSRCLPTRQGFNSVTFFESTLLTLLRDPRLQTVEILKDYRQPVDVEIDVAIIERVFINIILNAAQAMNSTGTLQITLEGNGAEAVVSFRDTDQV